MNMSRTISFEPPVTDIEAIALQMIDDLCQLADDQHPAARYISNLLADPNFAEFPQSDYWCDELARTGYVELAKTEYDVQSRRQQYVLYWTAADALSLAQDVARYRREGRAAPSTWIVDGKTTVRVETLANAMRRAANSHNVAYANALRRLEL